MNSDENAKDPASKEAQEFEAALLDEEGIHLEAALDPESTVLEQEQREQEEPDPGQHLRYRERALHQNRLAGAGTIRRKRAIIRHGARPFLLKWPMQPAPSGQPQ